MSVDFDARLTGLAAGGLRHAIAGYDLVSAVGPLLAAPDITMLGGFDATGSFPALTGSLCVLTGSSAAVGTDAAEVPAVTLRQAFRLPGKLPGVRLPPEPELAAMA